MKSYREPPDLEWILSRSKFMSDTEEVDSVL